MALTTVSGTYYVGMTRNQAKDKDEFDRIDVDKNKKLSKCEICHERDVECSKAGDNEGIEFSLGFTLGGIAGFLFCRDARNRMSVWKQEQEYTDNYRKQHKNDKDWYK